MFGKLNASAHRNQRFWPVARPGNISAVQSLIFIIGVFTAAYATAYGIGISPDSVNYIATAQSILNGTGARTYTGDALTHFPPLFPYTIAAISTIGINAVDAAHFLNTVLLGATASSISFMLYLETRKNLIASVLAGALTITSVPLLLIHSWAWSEPLFIFLGLWGVYLLAVYFKSHQSIAFYLSAICIGLAFITRYAGIALIITGIIGIFIFNRHQVRRVVWSALSWGLLCVLPAIMWMVRNVQTSGTATNREVIYHPITLSKIKAGIVNVLQWLLPGARSLVVVACVLAVIIIISLYVRRRSTIGTLIHQTPNLVVLMAVFSIVYPAFLVISISFLDAATPLDNRILSPLFPVFTILLLICSVSVVQIVDLGKLERAILAGLILLFLVLHLLNSARLLAHRNPEDTGYNAPAWKTSQTLTALNKLPENITIYSNAPDAIYFLTNRHALAIPRKFSSNTLEENGKYNSELQSMREDLEGGAVLVLVDLVTRRYLPTESELLDVLPLTLMIKTGDGVIYTIA